MILTRGSFQSFDYDRMVVLFSMRDDRTDVPCAISTSAMDDLEKSSGLPKPARAAPGQREEQFLRLRDKIEEHATRKYQALELEGTPPRIVLRSIDFR